MHRCALVAKQKREELTLLGEREKYKEERDVLRDEENRRERDMEKFRTSYNIQWRENDRLLGHRLYGGHKRRNTRGIR